MSKEISWPQVLAWRLGRQFVSGPPAPDAMTVVRRLCGVQSQVTSSARLAVAARTGSPGLEAPLWEHRSMVKTWLMRGTLHVIPAADLADYCAALSEIRSWEKGAWQRGHGVSAAEIEAIVRAVPEALGDTPLTREELVEAIFKVTGDEHLREALTSGWGALLKPLSRLGELCYATPRDGKVTFTAPRTWLAGWPSALPASAEAGPRLARAFLGAHGPATPEMFGTWLYGVAAKKTMLRSWFTGDDITEIEVDGARLLTLGEHADSLAETRPSAEVHLLPGFDQYILAAPRSLEPLIPAGVKPKVSRQAGWISPVVVYQGRVAGVWEAKPSLTLDLFEDVPKAALATAVDRMSALLEAAR
ncbi:winged helix DNA-binding domain-containing protein [Nonomuraea sp. NBC_01738]|uniref:winged helix DNA-binding domain-containing protein n=1 Tax=Nonomuraea sp. NBC_01738 TaxID=2976003 RepID=UPI002E141B85|nr:winged helix DNA-binding domain-containing protein [Nonomuraea sp. NBC_01738]